MLRLDQDFYDAYFKYYGELSPFEAADIIRKDLNSNPGYTMVNAMNIAKTSATLNQTYLDFYMEMTARKSFALEKENGIDKNIFNVAFVYMYEVAPEILESFLGIRFKVRDVYAVIAQQAYGRHDEEAIEKVKAIKTEHAGDIQLPNPVSRDKWFYDLTITVGSYSKCHSRKIGAVLVKDNSIISTGYNGPPRGAPTCDQRWVIDKVFKEKYGHHIKPDKEKGTTPQDPKGICPRRIIGFPSGEGLDICPAGHAERNALINAARFGIETKNTKLYMSCGIPCTPCMVEIINAGVEEIICCKVTVYDETAIYLLENNDIKVRIFDFLV